MKLTPVNISNKQFKKAFNGYNADEVDVFLDDVVESYEELYRENSQLKEKITSLNDKIEQYSKVESAIQNTLILAQNAADQAKKTAKKEAEEQLQSAREEAELTLRSAQDEAELKIRNANESADKRLRTAELEADQKIKDADEQAEMTLKNAKEEAEQKLKGVTQEVELKITNATAEAAAIVEKARRDVMFMQSQYERAKNEFLEFRKACRSFLEGQLDSFGSLESDFAEKYPEESLESHKNDPPKEIGNIDEQEKSSDEVILQPEIPTVEETTEVQEVHDNESDNENIIQPENIPETVQNNKEDNIDMAETMQFPVLSEDADSEEIKNAIETFLKKDSPLETPGDEAAAENVSLDDKESYTEDLNEIKSFFIKGKE